jgi:formiminotetrahydrofolate cyclodeaminase
MNDTTIAASPVEDLIARIGSNRVTPGAGAAGAVALALGAACAAKAVAISLKHRPAEVGLQHALVKFEHIASLALKDADRDSAAFAGFLRSPNADSAARLVKEGDQVAHLIDALLGALAEVESDIEPTMAGDLLAARALAAASRSIQQSNEAETKDAAVAPTTPPTP